MRKIFLPLAVILFFFICASSNAQIGGFCNASVGSIAITSSTGNGCPGNNSTSLTLSGTHVGSLQWIYSLDGVNWVEIDGETGTSYTADDLTVTTRYALRATFTGISGTCSELSNIIVISIAPLVWYKDHDDDHYSDGTSLTQCTNPGADYKLASQLTATTGDCNDNNPSVHPGVLEVFDGIDNNCDGAVDEGFHDYIIPAGISSINLTVQGAKGGSFKNQQIVQGQPFGNPSMFAAGGAGVKLTVKFAVETNCQAGLKPGGKLRLIVGATPAAVIRNVGGVPTPTFPGTSGQGGGGGSAILYQAPGASEWVLLAVAGGGGGALITNVQGGNIIPTAGLPAIQQPFDLDKTGVNGMGGIGDFIPGVPINPRDPLVTGPPTPLSGGGGGAFGDAINYCGGEKGMEQGGQTVTSVICIDGKPGGYGFGAGGSGFTGLDDPATLLNDEGGSGGGGGGYSGGNGGNESSPGFGGGSYISDLAIESSWLTSSPADNGSIILETNPIDNSDCCDPEALAFTGSYADQNLGCNPPNPDASLGTATATDAGGAVTITSTDGPVISDGCNRSRTRIFTATDGCLNTSTTSRTVRWIADLTPPAFTGSYADLTLGCNPANPDGSLGSASATDVCGAVTITQSDGAVVSDGCNRSRTRTFTAADGCLNTATTSRTVRWIADLTPAAFTGSYADVNLGCNPGNPDGVLGTATATDVCGAVTITSSDGAVVSDGCNRSRTRTFTATDGCLNTATTSRTIRWIADLTPPSFTGSYADQNLGCNPGNPDGALGTATATDVCGAITITSSDGAVVSDGCNRSRTRTFTATDGCLNTATTSRTIRWIADLTPPSFTDSYADQNLGCNPGNPDGSLGTATATDVCGAVTITSSDGAVVSHGCNRSRTRTFTATDGCLNSSTTSRTVRWIADLTPPSFTGSYADQNLGCNPANPDGALGTATATDVCGAVTITSSDGAVVSNGCSRSRTRTFTATDGCLNTSTTSRTVRWIADFTPPAFTGSYPDVNLGCNPASPDGSLGTATATDICGAVTITSTDGAVVSDGCNRSRTRTFTATDGCLNTATTSRTVRWIADLTPPSFTGSYADQSLGCNPANPDGSLGTATATDVCGAVTITSSDGAVVSDGCNRSRTRTFTATDGCLNTATTSRTVRWIADLTPPAITGSYADVNLGCNPANPDGSLGTASATDVCGAVTITSSDGAVQSNGCNRSRTRTFTATDGCLNTSTTSRTVRWIYDVTAPTLTSGGTTLTLEWNPNAIDIDAALGTATATDACGDATVISSDGSVTGDCLKSQTRTFTANDACGNTSTVSRKVTWKYDKTPPVITNASSSICILSPANHKMRDVTITYSLTDNCGETISSVLSVSSNEPSNGTGDGDVAPDWEVINNQSVRLRAERSGSGDGRVYTITIAATDAAGNTSTSSVEVRVTHNITSPQSGKSFKVGSTVSLEGEFWDKSGNKHSATWLIDDNTTVKGTVTEPTATKNGKVTGSYKFTAPGVYKLQMNTKDQNNVVSYANTNGDLDAIIVIYDPNGGYTYGGGYFNSPAGAVTSSVSATGKASYGFSVNYFKGATYPKGETQFEFKVGEFEFNALNFEYMSIAGAKAQMKGTGKIIGGQSGINFILTVTDGQLDGTDIDKIRMKIYNKNTMEVYYDNQPGVSDAVDPTMPVQENSTVVISGSSVSNQTQSNQITTKVEQDIAPVIEGLEVRAMPNPSNANFRIVVNSNDLRAPVKLLVTDMLGRVIETRTTNAGQTITIGDKYISGTYAVRIMQGRKTRQLTLIKLSD